MKNKIGFIITTFERPELLKKSLDSLYNYLQPNWEIIIINQGNGSNNIEKYTLHDQFKYISIPFNSGLSKSRNVGIQKAHELGCDYCVIGSDSFLFNESILGLAKIITFMQDHKYDKCGFELYGCRVGWEGKLHLIPNESFELDFIDKRKSHFIGSIIPFWHVDICRNFYIASTESLLNTPFDDNLKLGEHELQAYDYKQNGYKTLWTYFISATKMTDRPNEYSKYRKINFDNGLQYLKKKLGLKKWISYKHLEYSKQFIEKKDGN